MYLQEIAQPARITMRVRLSVCPSSVRKNAYNSWTARLRGFAEHHLLFHTFLLAAETTLSTFNTGCAHYCQLIEFIFEHNQLHVIMSFSSSPEPTAHGELIVYPWSGVCPSSVRRRRRPSTIAVKTSSTK